MATQEHAPGSPELSVFSTDVEAPLPPHAAPFLLLEIRRGRTGYPQRPVTSRNFLIGSGPACDLRLGGEDIPAAHSLLVVMDDEVRVQWLADAPPLLLNGEPMRESAIHDGDQIGIGRFEFIVRRFHDQAAVGNVPGLIPFAKPASEAMETGALLGLLSQAKELEETEDLSELSADELADRLEADQDAVENFEEAVQQGEAALLYAAARRAEEFLDEAPHRLEHDPNETPAVDDADKQDELIDDGILLELEKVIEQLSGFSAELDQRANRIANQEATQAEAAELLLDAQKELAAQLERFHQQVTESQDAPEPKLRKAA